MKGTEYFASHVFFEDDAFAKETADLIGTLFGILVDVIRKLISAKRLADLEKKLRDEGRSEQEIKDILKAARDYNQHADLERPKVELIRLLSESVASWLGPTRSSSSTPKSRSPDPSTPVNRSGVCSSRGSQQFRSTPHGGRRMRRERTPGSRERHRRTGSV